MSPLVAFWHGKSALGRRTSQRRGADCDPAPRRRLATMHHRCAYRRGGGRGKTAPPHISGIIGTRRARPSGHPCHRENREGPRRFWRVHPMRNARRAARHTRRHLLPTGGPQRPAAPGISGGDGPGHRLAACEAVRTPPLFFLFSRAEAACGRRARTTKTIAPSRAAARRGTARWPRLGA